MININLAGPKFTADQGRLNRKCKNVAIADIISSKTRTIIFPGDDRDSFILFHFKNN